jgi:hypothetical protein
MAAPFKSLLNNCKHIIIKIPAAIKKFPQTNVFGNIIRTDAKSVIAPFNIMEFLLKFHLPNISSISGFEVSIFQPCFAPINTAIRIRSEFRIFIIINLKGKGSGNSPFQKYNFFFDYLVVYPPFVKMF